MKLHHVALGARDVEGVAAFYRDRLGLREVRRHHESDGQLRSVWLDLGGALLMIEFTDQPSRPVQGIGAGPFLIAVTVAAEKRAALASMLTAAGFPAESRSEHTLYFRDPEGNRVAISSFPLPGANDNDH